MSRGRSRRKPRSESVEETPPTFPISRRAAIIAALSVAVLALAVPLVILRFRGSILVWDAEGYRLIADAILDRGLFAAANPYRTYGYPLFIAMCARLVGRRPDAIAPAVIAGQVLVHLAASAWAARRLTPSGDAGRRLILFGSLALHPFVLLQSAEQLTEVMGATLLMLAVVLSLSTTVMERSDVSAPPPRVTARDTFLAMLLAGLSVAVRPVNAIVAAALGGLVFLRVLSGHARPRVLFVGLLGVILPLVPQAYSNALAFGKLEPLVVERVYAFHMVEGMRLFKYTTSIAPGTDPHLEYRSAFSDGTRTPPSTFLREKPLAYVATLAIHGFALLDWDQVFSYTRRVAPWYRWITTPLSFLLLFFAAVGLRPLARGARRHGSARWDLATLAVVCVVYTSVLVPTAVENRFSLPLYVLLAPWSGLGAASLWNRWRTGTLRRPGRLLAGIVLLALVSLGISLWIASHARLLPA